MSYVNYWNQEDNVSPNGDFGVLKYPELKYLIDQIDFKHVMDGRIIQYYNLVAH